MQREVWITEAARIVQPRQTRRTADVPVFRVNEFLGLGEATTCQGDEEATETDAADRWDSSREVR